MVQAFLFSEGRGLCAKGTGSRVAAHLESAGLPTKLADVPGELPSSEALVGIMHQDKKAIGGELTFILAHGIGEAFIARKVPGAEVIAFLEKDRQR
jgi:3-dehydroquinate synthetase